MGEGRCGIRSSRDLKSLAPWRGPGSFAGERTPPEGHATELGGRLLSCSLQTQLPNIAPSPGFSAVVSIDDADEGSRAALRASAVGARSEPDSSSRSRPGVDWRAPYPRDQSGASSLPSSLDRGWRRRRHGGRLGGAAGALGVSFRGAFRSGALLRGDDAVGDSVLREPAHLESGGLEERGGRGVQNTKETLPAPPSQNGAHRGGPLGGEYGGHLADDLFGVVGDGRPDGGVELAGL